MPFPFPDNDDRLSGDEPTPAEDRCEYQTEHCTAIATETRPDGTSRLHVCSPCGHVWDRLYAGDAVEQDDLRVNPFRDAAWPFARNY